MVLEKMFFNVSKKSLNAMIDSINIKNYKKVTFSKCTNCPFFKKDNDFVKRYCNEFCKEKNQTHIIYSSNLKLTNITLKKYTNNLNKNIYLDMKKIKQFKLKKLIEKKEIKLSHLQSLQLLAFYYFANSKGYVKNISKKRISNLINCSIKTVENNNKILEKLGFIVIGNSQKGYFSAIINNYKKQHEKKGKGFFVFSVDLFKTILNIKNVNNFRLVIKGLLKNDVNMLTNRDNFFSIYELKNLLPHYLHNKASLMTLFSELNKDMNENLINIEQSNLGATMFISRELDGKTIRSVKKEDFKNEFNKIVLTPNNVDEINNKSKEKLVDDLIALSFEFGFDIVKDTYLENCNVSNITNLGGFIREQLKLYAEINEAFFDKIA